MRRSIPEGSPLPRLALAVECGSVRRSGVEAIAVIYRSAREEIAALVEEPGRGLAPAVPDRPDVRWLVQFSRAGRTRDYLMMRLLYASGIRRQELAHLKVCDCDFDSASLFVRASKSMKDRFVLMDFETARLLRDWLGDAPPERLVFEMTISSVSRIFRQWADKSGLYAKYIAQRRALSPHAFRHAFATHAYENGLEFHIISRLLGHTFAATTAVYTRTARLQIDAAYDRSHPFATTVRQPTRSGHGQSGEGADSDGAENGGGESGEGAGGGKLWPDQLEFQAEFACQLAQGDVGYFLPVVPFRSEMAQMLRQARGPLALLLRTCYATGLHLYEALALRPEDLLLEQRRLRVGQRSVRVDEATQALLQEALPLELSLPEAQQALLAVAEQCGVARRFAAAGRTFTPEAVRFAYAVHSTEMGMDRMSLMNQLGHEYLQAASTYGAAAVGQYREAFDRYFGAEWSEAIS